ncbi:galactokinase [Malassezia sp. CBS 17886]|nr:galactokinase [Malassezia sp. CBS 17886]
MDCVPLLPHLQDIYSAKSLAVETPRWDALREAFESEHRCAPAFFARAPGRVNLIGEHIDYVGFSVFPAAIEKDIVMAAALLPSETPGLTCELHNMAPRFAPTTFSCHVSDAASIELVHSGATRWANYFKVALRGLAPHLPSSSRSRAQGRLCVVIDGTVPPESSLSSSAAMTTCSSIVILTALGAREEIPRSEMAEVAIESERLVGVNSGGMDQAVSIFGIANHALYVSFVPKLHTEPVPLPNGDEDMFVVSNTLLASDKKVMGPVQFNLRVVETRMAARVLAAALHVDANLPAWRVNYRNTLRAVSDAYWAANTRALDEMCADARVRNVREQFGDEAAQYAAFQLLVDKYIPTGGLTRDNVAVCAGLTHDEMELRADHFHLHDRASHVFAEALRVLKFRAVCDAPRASGAETRANASAQLGALMNQSQESLRTLYDCSCPELDEVVGIAREHGSLGSRLTGAGWGGCAVHFVPRKNVDRVLKALTDRYYGVRYPDLSKERLDDALFATQPAQGACVCGEMQVM